MTKLNVSTKNIYSLYWC